MLTRIRQDDGAVAVVVGILAIALFGFGALAVDIGNMFSRKRMAQSAADFAALAGAAQLPDVNAATNEAYDYLATHDPVGDGAFTKAQLTDNNPDNGEIVVDSVHNTVSVDLAPRKVAFGLAAAMGFQNGFVSAHAVAALRSPSKLLPFFLPIECSNGPQVIKEGAQSSGPVTEPTPVFVPSASGGNPSINTINPNTTTQGTAISTLNVLGNHFKTSGMRVDFTRGDPANGGARFEVTPSNVTTGSPDSLTVAVPSQVTDTVGKWFVRVMTDKGWSSDDSAVPLTVTAAVPPPPSSCGQKSTGDFGMLDSPRRDVNGNVNRLDRNIALGLDHGIVEFKTRPLPSDTQPDNCRTTGNAPISGGVLDDDPTIDNANCLDINNGNKVDAATDGLILGGAGFSGRLTGAAGKACPGAAGGPNPTSFMNRSINNDTIDCYLLPGHDISDLTDPGLSSPVLDPKIVDSPRFFFVPVINYELNPPNGFYPVVGMRGVFITDATSTSAATSGNGLTTNNSGNKLTQIQVLAFNIEALPTSVAAGGNGIPYFGSGPKIVRLTE